MPTSSISRTGFVLLTDAAASWRDGTIEPRFQGKPRDRAGELSAILVPHGRRRHRQHDFEKAFRQSPRMKPPLLESTRRCAGSQLLLRHLRSERKPSRAPSSKPAVGPGCPSTSMRNSEREKRLAEVFDRTRSEALRFLPLLFGVAAAIASRSILEQRASGRRARTWRIAIRSRDRRLSCASPMRALRHRVPRCSRVPRPAAVDFLVGRRGRGGVLFFARRHQLSRRGRSR